MPEPSGGDPALIAVSLGCVRNERTLFAGLDFSVGPGEVLHVRGANGAGKSSLLHILCGLAQPDSGEVRWRGSSITALGPRFAGQINYVGHGNALKLDLDARENLEFLRELLVRDGSRPTDAILEDCGLGASADVPVGRLSAGQRRRLSLARLLLGTAPLWLLDEPFTSLDVAGREFFTRLIDTHAAGGGIAVIAGHEPIAVRAATSEVLLG